MLSNLNVTRIVVFILLLDKVERHYTAFNAGSELNTSVNYGASANSSSSAAPTSVRHRNTTVGGRAAPITTDVVGQVGAIGEGAVPVAVGSSSPFVLWQQQSQRALDQWAVNSPFDSAFSTHARVLKNGYPFQWNPCTLHTVLGTKENKEVLTIAVVGGSASARSADKCSDPVKGALSGRYSNILQRDLETTLSSTASSNPLRINVTNMAQGGTDSRASALLLDSRVDPSQHDVLLWEFAINDHAAGAEGLAMEFWLRRVYALYTKQKRPLPPLILLYFWDYRMGKQPRPKLSQNGAGLGSFPAQKPVIQKYQQLGWSIQVLAVGDTLERDAILKDKVILDDVHHPSCGVLHLVSSMIQRAIYKDMATCDITAVAQNSMTATMNNPPFDIPKLAKPPPPGSIAAFLLKPQIRLSSFSRWKPTIGTTFRTEPIQENNRLELVGKALDTRADRMASYVLPLCSSSEAPLEITLLEPDLRLVGLSFGEQGVFPTTKEVPAGLVFLRVNGSPVNYLSRQNIVSKTWISNWVDLTSRRAQRPSSYTLAFCRANPDRRVLLNFFVGLIY